MSINCKIVAEGHDVSVADVVVFSRPYGNLTLSIAFAMHSCGCVQFMHLSVADAASDEEDEQDFETTHYTEFRDEMCQAARFLAAMRMMNLRMEQAHAGGLQ